METGGIRRVVVDVVTKNPTNFEKLSLVGSCDVVGGLWPTWGDWVESNEELRVSDEVVIVSDVLH